MTVCNHTHNDDPSDLWFKIEVALKINRPLDVLEIIPRYTSLISMLKINDISHFEKAFLQLIKTESNAIDNIMSMEANKAAKFKRGLTTYFEKVISELMAKVEVIIKTINDSILDLAYDYKVLVYVLTILGDINQYLAQAISNLYKFSP